MSQASVRVRRSPVCPHRTSRNKQGKNWHPRLLLTSTHVKAAAAVEVLITSLSQVQVSWAKTSQLPNMRIYAISVNILILSFTEMATLIYLADPHLNPWQRNLYLSDPQKTRTRPCRNAAQPLRLMGTEQEAPRPEVPRIRTGPGNFDWPRPLLNTRALTDIMMIIIATIITTETSVIIKQQCVCPFMTSLSHSIDQHTKVTAWIRSYFALI